MIIREGFNVKYSHDEDALVDWLVGMREFAGVPSGAISGWIEELRPYSLCAEYLMSPDGYQFWPTTQYVYGIKQDELIRVMLWKPTETALDLIADHGFSCVVCAERTPYDERQSGSYLLNRILQSRQTLHARPMVCQECRRFLTLIFAGNYPIDTWISRAVSDLASRIRGKTACPA